jgi:nitrate reductase assembly molybdenum cofactor insertion protein NarJ
MTGTTADADPRVAQLLREATQWRLIGLLFSCPAGDWHAEVAALATEVADEQLKAAAEAAQTEAGEGLYHTTFGPGGPAAAREVSYLQSTLSGQFLAELRGMYEAFAYQPASQEPPDHVAVEADFVGYLRLKEAFAQSRGEEEHAAVTADAAQRILDEHLSAIAEPLARSLAASDISYLAGAAAALLQRVGPPRHTAPAMADSLPIVAPGCLPEWEES